MAFSIFIASAVLSTVSGHRVANYELVDSSARSGEMPVYANVYDLDDSRAMAVVNTLLFAGGAYHLAIEAFGEEWAYGGSDECCQTGIHQNPTPRRHQVHKFYKQVQVGSTRVSPHEFHATLRRLVDNGEWQGVKYDLLTHNCVSFSQALLAALPERMTLPDWMSRLMNVGATVLPALGSVLGGLSQSCAQSSQAVSEPSQVMSHKVCAYQACATMPQFNNMCGSFHLDGKWFSVACPFGFACHKFQQLGSAVCVPGAQFGPGPEAHLYDNNANGACAR